jgi:Allene oxide cyclase barrel like domain
VRTKRRLYAGVLAILVLGVLMSEPAAASSSAKGKRVLRIVATELQSQFLDLGTPGPSLGDELVFSERLSRHGRSVGVSGGVCTATQVEAPYDALMFQCVGTLKLKRGQITLQGLIEVQGEDDPGPFTVAITGGTGRYAGAGGKAVIREVSPTRSVYKLHFASSKKHHRK